MNENLDGCSATTSSRNDEDFDPPSRSLAVQPGRARRASEPTRLASSISLPLFDSLPETCDSSEPGEPAIAAPLPRSLARRSPLARLRQASSPAVRSFRRKFFPQVSDGEWNDWKWQTRNRIRSLATLEKMIHLAPDEQEALEGGDTMLPVGVTPYYMALVSPDDPNQPLRRTVVPSSRELVRTSGEADDPLGEDGHSPVPGLVHRYPDRVLFLVIDFCTTYCRYCTRSRVVGHGEIVPNQAHLERAIDYIRRHTEIRDVLISGGDPLSLHDDKLDWILGRLREIPHLEFLRIGTKMPAVLPQRITPQLVRMLRKHHPIWMSVHFTHPDECTPESFRACARLADAGIPLGSQTVLLKGVNDDVETMKRLVHQLLMMRVRPYYLYQCDPISGSSHFRAPVSKGLEIIQGLRGFTSGYGVPTFVIDAPGGGGKIPLLPNYVVGREGDDLILRNFEGRTFRYPDPLVAEHERASASEAQPMQQIAEELEGFGVQADGGVL